MRRKNKLNQDEKTEKLMTSAEVADELGYSHDYIRRMCLAGIIKAQKMGNTWVISKSAFKHIPPKTAKEA